MTFLQSWRRIEKIVLGGTGIIDFQSIPSNYDHLKIMLRVQSNFGTTGGTSQSLRFNADNGQNYRGTYNLFTTTGIINSGGDSTANTFDMWEILVGLIPQKNATTLWGMMEIDIPYYSTTGVYRNSYSTGVSMTSDTAIVNHSSTMGSGQWASTAIINRIQIGGFQGGSGTLGSFKAGSEASLWGLNE